MSVGEAASALKGTVKIVHGIARHPASIKRLPRMLRTLGKNPLDLRLAWLPFALMDELDASLSKESRVFEYGGGGSTAWFADRVESVFTAEHESEWFALLSARLAGQANVQLVHRPSTHDYEYYIRAIRDFPDEYFDLVVVDGRQRVRCFEESVPKVRRGGRIVLDDAQRKQYAPAFGLVDWPRHTVKDFAPCKTTLANSAVFVRPFA